MTVSVSHATPRQFWTPDGLESFASSSVFSIKQDFMGAIWLQTDRGVYRFNGNGPEFRFDLATWKKLESSDGTNIYVESHGNAVRFRSSTTIADTVFTERPLASTATILDCGDSLWIGSSNSLILCSQGRQRSVKILDEDIEITSLLRLPDRRFAIGTASHGILFLSPEMLEDARFPFASKVRALHLDSRGQLWVGLLNGGTTVLNPATLKIIRNYPCTFDGKRLSDVRSFAENRHGDIFMGTSSGLFKVDRDGILSEETLGGLQGEPVCCIFADKQDNLWAGTYYHGVLFSQSNPLPVGTVDTGDAVRIVKGLAEDRLGRIWISTDGGGMFRHDLATGETVLIPNTVGIKYQSAWYDVITDKVWAGEFRGDLHSYEIGTGRHSSYKTEESLGRDWEGSFCAILRLGDDLILGGTSGLYLFDPGREQTISRKVARLTIYDMEPDGTDGIYLAGIGLFHYNKGGEVQRIEVANEEPWMRQTPCYDLAMDAQGRLWMAFSQRGAVCLQDNRLKVFSSEVVSIADEYISNVIPCYDGQVLIVSNSALSLLHPETSECFNYNASNGLEFRTTIGNKSITLSDGTIWIGNNNGIKTMPPSSPDISNREPSVILDRLFVNGERMDCSTTLPFMDQVILGHKENNFSIEVTPFDYSTVQNAVFRYRLDGFDRQWNYFNPKDPVDFMNIAPGHYRFTAQVMLRNGHVISEASIKVRIFPVWYATLAAKISFITLIALIILIILAIVNSRMMLAEKLRLKEKENEEKTRFFVDLSYQLRTPVNLIIGQLERFFRDFGSRTAGIENIENIYGKAKEIRTMISDYVDTQNDNMTTDDMSEAMTNASESAKFLNSAIGAVERNLYSKDLNVRMLCSELNLGKTALTAKLKEVSGLTPREFIEDIRLKHAAEMLSDKVYRISEIADNLAFGSPKYFAHRFKLKYGVSPRDYKG